MRTASGVQRNHSPPAAITRFTCERLYRGVRYQISVEKPEGVCKGVRQMIVDGKPVSGNIIPLSGGPLCSVTVVLG